MVRKNSRSTTTPSKSTTQSSQQAEFDEFLRLHDGKSLDNGHTVRQSKKSPTHSTDVNQPAQHQVNDRMLTDSLVDSSNVDISDQVRAKVVLPSHLPTPDRQVLIRTSAEPTANPSIIQESKTNKPQEWPRKQTQTHVETNPAIFPRTRKLTGDATWPPGRPPSSGPNGPPLGGPGETILRVETDQGAATMAALDAWRKPIAPVSSQEFEEAFAALRRIGTSRPQVPSDSHPHRVEPPPHIPSAIGLETFRDPEAEVRTLPQDVTLHTPRTGVRYYTNTEANKRGALLELPRPRLALGDTDEVATNSRTGNNSHSGAPPVELTRGTDGAVAAPARTRVADCSGGGREDFGGWYGQGAVKTSTDGRHLDLVLEGRMTQDNPPRWVESMIKRIMTQVGPMELRIQVPEVPGGGSSDSAGRRAAAAQVVVDYSGDLTMREDAGAAATRLTLTLTASRIGLPQLRQDEVVDREGRCWTARVRVSMDDSSTSAWALDDASASTASSTRGLSGSTERITMLDGEERDLRSSPSHGGMLVAGIRSEVGCCGGSPVEPGCRARPSHREAKAGELRNGGDVTPPPSWGGSPSVSRPLTELAGFEWPQRGQRASTRGKRWTARVGVTMDDTGSLTARLLEDVTSTPREGRHVWHIGLERIVEGTERGEAALEAEDARLCRILEGPVIGEQLDSIRDTACVQDFGSMQKVLTRVLRLLGEGSGRGEGQKGPADSRILQDVPPLARPEGGGGGACMTMAGREVQMPCGSPRPRAQVQCPRVALEHTLP